MKNKTLTILVPLLIILLGVSIYLFFTNKEDEDTNETQQPDQTTDYNPETDNDIEEETEDLAYVDITVEEAYDLIQTNSQIIILDVSNRYEEGHIPNAINYYVGDGSLDSAIPTLDPDETYLVYCHVDSASILGSQKLIDAGFKSVYRLEGNYSAWVDAGYEIEM
jgi:rhodanese-related sulfurtransferase